MTAKQQPSGQIGTTAQRSDASLDKAKKPQGELGKQQVLATAGDTVPIAFGKRSGGIGGIWLQPSLIKTGTNSYEGSFLYAISQGEMSSSPQKYLAWIGNENLGSKAGTITLTHYYSSASTMAAATNACPITSGKIFCDLNTYSYLQPIFGDGGWTDRWARYDLFYTARYQTTRGVGDTTNSIVKYYQTDIKVIEQETGVDVTASYWAALGITPSPSSFYALNAVLSGTTIVGGNPVGTTVRYPTTGYDSPYAAIWSALGASGPIAYIVENAVIDDQVYSLNPPSSGTLYGIQTEQHISTYADPSSPPSSADFTSFADITFLEIDGDIYDPPTSGSYPTTTRQLCIYYDNGINVDLYSAGLSGGVYTQGASNQFVDLAMYLFKLIKRVDGAATADIATPIDTSNLQDIASYCTNNATFCNGVIDQSLNVIDFISSISPFFLLSFVSSDGQYSLQTLLPKNGSNQIDLTALTPTATFTESEILPGSFGKTYTSADDRRDVNVSLVWREVDPTVIGIQQTTIVRYATTANDAPSIQFDMTDICTSKAHAVIYGKYELAKRKHSTHTITFKTPISSTSLIPTQIIKVIRQRVSTAGDNRTETNWYQVTAIKKDTDGVTTIDAMHFPVDASSIATISDDVVNGTFEVT